MFTIYHIQVVQFVLVVSSNPGHCFFNEYQLIIIIIIITKFIKIFIPLLFPYLTVFFLLGPCNLTYLLDNGCYNINNTTTNTTNTTTTTYTNISSINTDDSIGNINHFTKIIFHYHAKAVNLYNSICLELNSENLGLISSFECIHLLPCQQKNQYLLINENFYHKYLWFKHIYYKCKNYGGLPATILGPKRFETFRITVSLFCFCFESGALSPRRSFIPGIMFNVFLEFF